MTYIVTPEDLATVDDLASHLLQVIDQEREPQAVDAIKAAQAVVRTYCRGWMLTPGRSTITVPFPSPAGIRAGSANAIALRPVRAWSAKVALPQSPVFEIHSVTVDGAETDWVLDDADVITLADTLGTSVAIEYSHGYALDAQELATAKLVTLRLAARLLTNPLQRQSYSNPDMNYSATGDAPARLLTGDERMMLDTIRGAVI